MSMFKRVLAAVAISLGLAVTTVSLAPPPAAHAATVTRHFRAYKWAIRHAGDWYVFGAAGPTTFDCSGLVMASYLSRGLQLPRTTYDMATSWHLRFESHADAKMGDIVFYTLGHVELYAGKHTTFGALHTGTRLGWHRWSAGSSWQPTAYARVVG